MPLKYFTCDAGKIALNDCMEACPRGERCLSLPTLKAISRQRPWTGRASTTQLINGTRLEYLKITEDYGIKPKKRAFALLGTRHHERLEAVSQELNVLSEEKLDGEVTGILDLLTERGDGTYELWDYKTSGSLKVAKVLGLVGDFVPDPSGAVYQCSSKYGKAGSPKMVMAWKPNPEAVDMWDWELQLNHYRILVEALGFPVSKMTIQCTVRDGGTYVAHNRGVNDDIYLVSVSHLPDVEVNAFFSRKHDALLRALGHRELPSPCDERERWQRRRCAGYCEVSAFCDYGGNIQGQAEED